MKDITKLVLGDREYELLPTFRQWEESITWEQSTQQAHTPDAQLDEVEDRWFLSHQSEIPVELEKFSLIFSQWRFVRHPDAIPCIRCQSAQWWRTKRWVDDWYYAGGYGRPNDGRLVRRVK